MKLILFGATGGIGKHVTAQALAAGHAVTAVVRRPSAVTLQHEKLTVVQGDVLAPETWQSWMAGQEAVISTIGTDSRGPTTLYSAGIAHIIQAMQSAGVRRLMCVSASGLDPGPLLQRWLAKPLLWWVFKHSYTDLVRMESHVKNSPLDWTILRPPRLTQGPLTKKYRFSMNHHLAQSWLLSRADLADYIITHLVDPLSFCAIVEVAQ